MESTESKVLSMDSARVKSFIAKLRRASDKVIGRQSGANQNKQSQNVSLSESTRLPSSESRILQNSSPSSLVSMLPPPSSSPPSPSPLVATSEQPSTLVRAERVPGKGALLTIQRGQQTLARLPPQGNVFTLRSGRHVQSAKRLRRQPLQTATKKSNPVDTTPALTRETSRVRLRTRSRARSAGSSDETELELTPRRKRATLRQMKRATASVAQKLDNSLQGPRHLHRRASTGVSTSQARTLAQTSPKRTGSKGLSKRTEDTPQETPSVDTPTSPVKKAPYRRQSFTEGHYPPKTILPPSHSFRNLLGEAFRRVTCHDPPCPLVPLDAENDLYDHSPSIESIRFPCMVIGNGRHMHGRSDKDIETSLPKRPADTPAVNLTKPAGKMHKTNSGNSQVKGKGLVCERCKKSYKSKRSLSLHARACAVSREETDLLPKVDEGEESDGIIQCICEISTKDHAWSHLRVNPPKDSHWVVQCEQCEIWLHVECARLISGPIPETYFCPKCAATGRKRARPKKKLPKDKAACPSVTNSEAIEGLFARSPPSPTPSPPAAGRPLTGEMVTIELGDWSSDEEDVAARKVIAESSDEDEMYSAAEKMDNVSGIDSLCWQETREPATGIYNTDACGLSESWRSSSPSRMPLGDITNLTGVSLNGYHEQ